MSKQSKKIISVCAAAALILTGCGNTNVQSDVPGFSFSENSADPQSKSSEKSDTKPPESSAKSSAESTPDEPVIQEPQPQGNFINVFYDPTNNCTLEFDGTTIVFSGSSDVVTDVYVSSADFVDIYNNEIYNVDFEQNGDEFVYTADCKSINGYFNLNIVHAGHSTNIRLKADENGVSFPDVSEVIQHNKAIAETPVITSPKATAKFITKDGSTERAAEILSEIKKISDEICEGLDSDYDKLRAISHWVSANIYYDHPAYKAGIPDESVTLEYMLDKHSSVCTGYSNMTSALCAAQGIYCVNINGEAINGGYCYAENSNGAHHEWNYAVIDGRGIWVDSGWNSYNTVSERGRYTAGGIGYFYFDIGSEVFALDHAASSAQYRDYFCPELYNGGIQ